VQNSGLVQRASKYLLYSWLLYSGPLSDLITVGRPCVANILSNFGITVEAFVDLTISTSGNREYLLITTSKYSPVGNGP
jgi:hypothetical protein